MPRRRSLLTVIRDVVREQMQEAVQGLLGAVGGPKKKAKNGRRRRRHGRGGRRGPGRPPGSGQLPAYALRKATSRATTRDASVNKLSLGFRTDPPSRSLR